MTQEPNASEDEAREQHLELVGMLSALDDLPVLHPATVAELRDIAPPDEPEFFAELVEEFERDATAQLAAMEAALVHNDASALGRAAHKLKGMSGTLGAGRVGRLAGLLQEQCGRGDLRHTPALLSRLRDEFDSARNALREDGEKGQG